MTLEKLSELYWIRQEIDLYRDCDLPGIPEKRKELIDQAAEMETWIAQQPPKIRQILHMKCRENMTYRQIGATLHYTPGAVKVALYNHFAKLKDSES